MTIVLYDGVEIESKRITIKLVDDVEIHLSINHLNELVVNKHQLGDGESAMLIKPSVSNEIRIY